MKNIEKEDGDKIILNEMLAKLQMKTCNERNKSFMKKAIKTQNNEWK